ncbi:TPM domain-containing protein [Paenibacillus wulumuqiensis]|uniref:TPM domain-containing protein n=1 Tax=Paenibacillus wulumuqiensis TaxID=1567107 RepID=UPI0006194B97|nr:TPM domain-containing protein [Paenibacillus wulumuqiensis]
MNNNKLQRNRYILVTLVLLLAVNLYLHAGSVQAAEQQGHIMDNAGLFSEKDISRMNARLDHHTYDLYVITGTGMNQSEGMKLANQMYEQFGFSGNQLLLFITTDPNYVHLVFDNEELRERIGRSNAGSIEGITDSQFVPYAKKGDLAGGVLAVNDYINGLGDLSNDNNNLPAPGYEQPALSDRISHSLRQVTFYVLGSGLAAALLTLLIVRAVASEKLHRRQARLSAQVDEWNERLNSIAVADSSNLPENGSIDGSTPARVNAWVQQIQRQSSQLHTLRGHIDSRQISLFSTAKPARELSGLEQQLNAQIGQIEELLHQHEHAGGISNLSRSQAESAVSNAIASIPTLSGQLPEQQSRHLLDAIERTDRELRLIVEQERLMVNNDNPFALLGHAREEAMRLQELPVQGDAEAITDSIRRIEEDIREARGLVDDLIRFREQSSELLALAPQQLDELQLLPDRYEKEVQLLREQYARVHVQQQRDRYAKQQELHLQVERLLPQIAAALDENYQQYRQANALSTEVRTVLEQMQQQRSAILGYRDELDLYKKQLMERWEMMSARHREGVQLLTAFHEDGMAAQQSQNESFHMLEQVHRRLMNAPFHLPELEEAMNLAAARLDVFLQEVQELTGITDPAQAQMGEPDSPAERPRTEPMRLFKNPPDDNH